MADMKDRVRRLVKEYEEKRAGRQAPNEAASASDPTPRPHAQHETPCEADGKDIPASSTSETEGSYKP